MTSLSLVVSPSLADPLGSSSLVSAAEWLQHTLLGTVATSVAIIAVLWVGLLMLSGRIDVRRGATVILGCFILFGAPSMTNGFRTVVGGGDPQNHVSHAPLASNIAPSPLQSPRPTPPKGYDPYAGASLPPQ